MSATIKPIDGRSVGCPRAPMRTPSHAIVSCWCRKVIVPPVLTGTDHLADPSDPVRSSHRRPLLRCQGAGREQLRLGRRHHRCVLVVADPVPCRAMDLTWLNRCAIQESGPRLDRGPRQRFWHRPCKLCFHCPQASYVQALVLFRHCLTRDVWLSRRGTGFSLCPFQPRHHHMPPGRSTQGRSTHF